MVLWDTPAEVHSAFNDLPAALLVFALIFDVMGLVTKRDSLRAAGFWCLMAGVGGAILSVVSGLNAEDWIEHGNNVHRFVERHETLAITTTIWFGALALWRVVRKDALFATRERGVYLGLSALGVGLLFWVGSLGGTIVYRHATGIPTTVLQEALTDRAAGHAHDPGEEHDHGDAAPGDSAAADHEHPPGTPEHAH